MVRRALARDDLHRYVRESGCTSRTVLSLWERFTKLDTHGRGYVTAEEATMSVLSQEILRLKELANNPFGSRLVALSDESGRGVLHFPRFVDLFAVFSSQALLDVKLAWAFAIWDFDGDDLIGANDMKIVLQLLCNGGMEELVEPAAETELQPMFDDQSTDNLQQNRRKSGRRDLLSSHELSQIVERIAKEVDPVGPGLSFEEFESVVGRMPDFAINFGMNI